jgi:hypothetical protein
MSTAIEIENMVGLLNDVAPSKLASLRDRFPEYRDQLQPGRLLGSIAAQKAHFLLAVATQAVDEARPLAEKSVSAAHRRLNFARKLDFVAQALSLLSSSGTVLLLVRKTKKPLSPRLCHFSPVYL